ncbi:MAG: FHA domain-containing protein [Burkholderiales bacterium]|nr:MAG: FHA domain-containing protein [Burkholderiales bacterium]
MELPSKPAQRERGPELARLVLTAAGEIVRQIPLVRERLTLGRRPYNDVQLDDMTVSGEHALILTRDGESVFHDLNSRNGSYVNGHPVKRRMLVHGDVIDVGVYSLRYAVEPMRAPLLDAIAEPPSLEPIAGASLHVLSGPDAGRVLRLERAADSIGGAEGQIAIVTRRRSGYYVTHLEGPAYPMVNGEPIGLTAFALNHDDLIELGSTMVRFRLHPE